MTDEQWAKLEPLARAVEIASAAVQRGILEGRRLLEIADGAVLRGEIHVRVLDHAALMRRLYMESNRALWELQAMERQVLNA